MLNDVKHPTHITKFSFDSSMYDEKCIKCGATDEIHSWGRLAQPCPNADQKETENYDKVD